MGVNMSSIASTIIRILSNINHLPLEIKEQFFYLLNYCQLFHNSFVYLFVVRKELSPEKVAPPQNTKQIWEDFNKTLGKIWKLKSNFYLLNILCHIMSSNRYYVQIKKWAVWPR